jgi:cytochrome c biogenesis protein CcdA
LAIVFVVGGILIATDGAGRWSPPLSRTLRVAGGVIIIAFGVLLVVQALV